MARRRRGTGAAGCRVGSAGQDHIHRQPVQPGAEGRLSAKGAQLLPHADEHVLRHLIRVFLAQHSADQAVDPRDVRPVEPLEGVGIPAGGQGILGPRLCRCRGAGQGVSGGAPGVGVSMRRDWMERSARRLQGGRAGGVYWDTSTPSGMSTTTHAPITAPTGTTLTCKGWHQEAALRMLMNNLDPAVAERPEELIVYGGGGKAARNWACYERSSSTLRRLDNDETLLVQSGKPVGVFRTHDEAPRVLIANANLVPRWATWDEFRRLDALGLTMYGQMTAGSWIYIGTQGILQGTYETFAECARQHFGGTLAGRLVVTGGLGGMGGAQPLAATMNGAAFLGVDVDESRIRRRVETGYCDRMAHDLDEALGAGRAMRRRRGGPLSVGPGRQHRRGAARAGPARHRARRAHRPDLGARPACRATSRRA